MNIKSSSAWKSLAIAGRVARAAFFPGLPPYLIFFVTHRCNAACAFCFNRGYASDEEGKELTLSEIEKIASSWQGILQVTLTGGEPLLREEVAEIACAWVRAGAQSLTIDTNGTLTQKAVKTVAVLLEQCPGLVLDLNISIHGPQDLHDRLLGVPGAYEKAMTTAQELASWQERHPHLRIGATLTLSSFNQEQAPETIAHLLELDTFHRVQVLWVRGRPADPAALACEPKVYQECRALLDQAARSTKALLRAKQILAGTVRELVARTITENRLIIPCKAGATMVEMDAYGRVFPCELLPQLWPQGDPDRGVESWVMGVLPELDYDISKALASDNTRKIKTWIHETGCFCTFECAAYNNLVFTPACWPRLAWRICF